MSKLSKLTYANKKTGAPVTKIRSEECALQLQAQLAKLGIQATVEPYTPPTAEQIVERGGAMLKRDVDGLMDPPTRGPESLSVMNRAFFCAWQKGNRVIL